MVPNGQSLALVLRAGILITGTVLDPDGNPAPGARVEATETGRQGGVVGVADEAGRFALRVPAGKTYSVAASLKDRFGHYQRATLEDVTGGDVVLRFPYDVAARALRSSRRMSSIPAPHASTMGPRCLSCTA